MKKFWIILISVIVGILVLNGVIIYLIENWESEHYQEDHRLSERYNKEYHWKECEKCGAILERGLHVFNADGECMDCYAFSGQTEFVQYEEAGDHARVVSCEYVSHNGKVRILPTYNGLPVTEIGEGVFKDFGLWGVVIPESVVSIGASAFQNCKNLKQLMLPDGLMSIGESAFQGCDGLTDIEFNNGLMSIGKNAFYECNGLTNVNVPDSVISIGECAFYGCKNLTHVDIPGKITSISRGVFWHCTNLSSVNLSKGITSIGESAFQNCASLTNIELPTSVVSIGNSAFEWGGLTSIDIPDSVISIGETAFALCYHLTSVNIPDAIHSIGMKAFYECDRLQFNEYGNAKYLGNSENPYVALIVAAGRDCENYEIHSNTKVLADNALIGLQNVTRIEIPDGVTHIGANALKECGNLTAVIIPKSVVYIGKNAFDLCERVTFYCKAESQPSGWHTDWNVLNREIIWNY